MHEVDSSQRGDIYKFLYQAETKEKDIEELLGNMNKINMHGAKDGKKLKLKTFKYLASPVFTEHINVQTDLSMQLF